MPTSSTGPSSAYPLRPGVVDEPGPHQDGGLGTLTYGDLADRARALAAGLDELGVGVGERVAVVSQNSARLMELLLGGTQSGRIVVPVNFRLSRDEVAYIVEPLRREGAAGRPRARRGARRR